MNNNDKELIKRRLGDYLRNKGINTRKHFKCLNPLHNDKHPSMSYFETKNGVKCFSCGAWYDIFDLIGIDYGLTEYRDIFNKAEEMYGFGKPRTAKKDFSLKGEVKDFELYFKECHNRVGQTDYPKKRGLSEFVISEFNLGYDPDFRGMSRGAFIIPTGKGSFVARNVDPNADDKNRYRKTGNSLLFNGDALRTAQIPIFVVEGEIDALSIMTAGGVAIGLGSVANVDLFLREIEKHKPKVPIILSLDNDESGEVAQNRLVNALEGSGIVFYRFDICNPYKDANEALLCQESVFRDMLKKALNVSGEEYRKNNSTLAYIKGFIDRIQDSVQKPYISTGFAKLDEILDGGLFEGLYIIGAISSLGKTTFVSQISDQIAQTRTDILYFSLEMSRNELIAKSVSRQTAYISTMERGNTKLAKTMRGITTGKRYLQYSHDELSLIRNAEREYSKYAEYIYIIEGIGEVGVFQIREAVKQHIKCTGCTPVIVIDYLQILSPSSFRLTDKQNTDKAVLELKRISRDFKIPIIAVSSFNRANYSSQVTMESFKESGAIEYSSDVLIGLQFRDVGSDNFNVNTAKSVNPRSVSAVVLKNRNGAAGCSIPYSYYPLFNLFLEN
ncbi:hypothetical protein AGMMS49975_00470 [Clostridia bacterium]|nr:hypothetical protein AGMMS49975_00470 [Clostridia bacterium]